ncbi:MAG: hypothetical protein ACYTEZ_17805 [Planctomycetota bacterium]|jgi:hypothetical protein
MRRWVSLALLAPLLCAQGGRDAGRTGRAILFVRMQRTAESGDIYRAAWSALEPHFVDQVNRRRLADFDGDANRARAYFAQHEDVVLVVAFGEKTARLTREILPRTPVLEVSPSPAAHVSVRVDRERLARLLKTFHPRARRVWVVGGHETLRDLETRAEPEGCDLAWANEGAAFRRADLRETLNAATPPRGTLGALLWRRIPIVSTSETLPAGTAVLTVRPDPTAAGLKVAVQVLRKLRDRRPFETMRVAQLRVEVDLRAARRVDYDVSLKLLARADVVRRAR